MSMIGLNRIKLKKHNLQVELNQLKGNLQVSLQRICSFLIYNCRNIKLTSDYDM